MRVGELGVETVCVESWQLCERVVGRSTAPGTPFKDVGRAIRLDV